jgi:flagellar biosynthesis/type III secretory pathway protein FliH
MTTDRLYTRGAAEIMALVDEFPSEPFSVERKWLEEKLVSKLMHIADLAADEDEAAYQTGYDNGYEEAKDEAEDRIAELESDLEDAQAELAEALEEADRAFADGFETGARSEGAETIELS